MYCNNCGTQLPDDANFCMRCGKPQKEGVKPIELRWETCEISYRSVEKAMHGIPSKLKWEAGAIGPNGKYVAGETSIFEGQIGLDYPFTFPDAKNRIDSKAKERNKIAQRALDDLITKLSEDGWDYVGKYGDSDWKLRLRWRAR